MFELLTSTKTLFRSINVLGENHGKEIHPGLAVAFEFVVGNDWLNTLSRGLKSTLYSKTPGAKPEGQQPLELEVVSDMPHVRYPELSQLQWDKEYTGVTLFIEHGATGDNIWVRDCKVSSLALTLMEGGSVKVKGSATSSNPDEHERGRITSKIKQEALHQRRPIALAAEARERCAP